MTEIGFWPGFVMAALATWRVTHLLANEDGPADLIVRLRKHLGSGFAGNLIDCFQCLSLWIAAPMALFVSGRLLDLLITWLALSGAACLLERMGQEAAVIKPLLDPNTSQGEMNHGMLWSEASVTQNYSVADDDAERRATGIG